MNIYISKEYANVFLENLKEIPIIDDYNLDRERLGKEKIKLQSESPTTDVIAELLRVMPIESMLVDQIEYPGNKYMLCVGEINAADFYKLASIGLLFSIITVKSNHLRFNAWIKLDKLQELFASDFVNNLSSINGSIDEYTFFVFEATEGNINELHKIISVFSDELIINGNYIYAKIFMHNFSKIYTNIESLYNKIDVIDANGD